jgi:hypothetical protein
MAKRISVLALGGALCGDSSSVIQVDGHKWWVQRVTYPVFSMWCLLHQASGSSRTDRGTADCR